MIAIPNFLSQYTDGWVLIRIEGNIVYIDGIKSDVDLLSLETELRDNWEELLKKELGACINNSCLKKIEEARPKNFQDLVVKASLEILSQEEINILTEYYTYANTIREACEELKQEIINSNLSQINQITLPDWVICMYFPMNPVFLINQRMPNEE